MKNRSTHNRIGENLGRPRLDQMINMRHELVMLADRIDWTHLDQELTPAFAADGRPSLRPRLMIGLFLLKEIYRLSDEKVCDAWLTNPYYQYFCGEVYFQHYLPFERSSLSQWRKRLGESFIVKLLQESLRIAKQTQALNQKHLKRVVVDTTVQPKAITFPTDARLLFKALAGLVKLAKHHSIKLRQTYLRVCKKALQGVQRYRHAKQYQRAQRLTRFIRHRLFRVFRDIKRHLERHTGLRDTFREAMQKAWKIGFQETHSKQKLYSWHAPEVECIGKGKVDKPYEFGCKVSVTTNVNPAPGGHFILHIAALHGNPFDGHTLKGVIEQMTHWIGVEPERIYVDRGYRGHDYTPAFRVFKSGQKRGVTTPTIKRELRRRSAIEPVIGHLKSDGHLGRNYLKGELGDRMNALLCAAGYNFRLLLKWLHLFLACLLTTRWAVDSNTQRLSLDHLAA